MTRKKTLAPLADLIARDIADCTSQSVDWETLREECDRATDGELDCWPLDILTDMVAQRLESIQATNPEPPR